MKLIVAVDREWGIGKANDLLFSIPEDMKFFRSTTMGKVIVIGRKTLQSFPGGNPLKNRVNVVLSSALDRDDVTVVNDIPSLMREIGRFPADDVFVCGGASVYKTLLPYCSEALVTKVDAVGGADTYFPNLDEAEGWVLTEEGEPIETNGYVIRFCKYANKNAI